MILGRLKEAILKDAKLKILSFILAVMLWFAISYMGESKVVVPAKVVPKGLRKDLIITKIAPEEVPILIKGPASILKSLKNKDIQVLLDMSQLREGGHIYYLKRENILVPKEIKIEEIKSDYVAVETDRLIEKRLKVVVKLDRKWRGLYTVKTWEPLYVTVEGSRASLQGKDSIETFPVDDDFMAEEERVEVGLDGGNMAIKRIVPDKIRVTLRRR
ncbi:MAG: CdaR family protein [Syntrophorhabdaceae bacterium]|nr:CdaR family protein [Syntrophorhabdaceae bacterium]